MPMARAAAAAVLLVTSICLMAVASFIAYPILSEVNGTRQPSDQYPDSSFRSHFFAIWREHERAFPSSRRRTQFIACFLAAVVCLITSVVIALL